MNVQDITPQNVSSENEISPKTNPLYKLIEIQANRFEEFGNRMKLQLHTLYQEYTKQRDETLKNNLIEFEKIGKIYQKQIESQSELIDQLIVRIENLEINSNKKDQDVGNLKEDFNNFLKSKKEIKDVGLKDDVLEPSKSSHEESTNNFSSCFANNYNLSSSSSLKINSFDQENQETVSKLERIHTQIQQLVTTFSYKIKLKHIKSFVNENSFTSADLIQYTKASNFNLLNDKTKNLINLLIKEMSSNENDTTKLKQHHAQMITEEIKGSNLKNNLENENLKPLKTTDDESDYLSSCSSCFSDDNLSSSSSLKMNSFDQESQETVSKLERIHTKLQQLVTKKETLGIRIRLKHIKSFIHKNSFTSADLIQYTKASNFNLLNDETKSLINRLIKEMSSNENNTRELKQHHAQMITEEIEGSNLENNFENENLKPSKTVYETAYYLSKLGWIHTQIQQLVTQKENLGFKIRLKHIKSFVHKNSITSADLIRYTKASNFNLLNDETKSLISRLIKEMSSNENNTRELKHHHAQMITEEIEGSNLENNENLKPSKTLGWIHTQIQQLVTQKENLGLKIRLRHIKSFVNENSITSADLIQYMKKSNFNLLNDETKRFIYLLAEEMLSEYEDITTNEASKLEQLHAQIIIKSKLRGKGIKRKDLTFLCRPSKFNILIPYTKTHYFYSLSKKVKNLLNIIINDELQKELIPLELKLSQNLEEYIKRDLIPPLPAGYDSYAEYKNSDIFRSLSISQRWKVSKLVKFQEEKIKIDEQIKEDLAKDVLILDGKEFKFIS